MYDQPLIFVWCPFSDKAHWQFRHGKAGTDKVKPPDFQGFSNSIQGQAARVVEWLVWCDHGVP